LSEVEWHDTISQWFILAIMLGWVEDSANLYRRADDALYPAKSQGRAQVIVA